MKCNDTAITDWHLEGVWKERLQCNLISNPGIYLEDLGNITVGTSHLSDNQHMSVAMQRLVDFISMVTQ
jgi:hypothetical protein